MKISYDWLQDYLDIKKSPEELAEDLSLFGFTTEAIEKVGTDTVLDLEINPNRGDCLSVIGIAREVAAMYDIKIKNQISKTVPKGKIDEEKLDKKITVTVSEPRICPRFTARVIDNIEIKPSPKWLQERLVSYGFRSINNIVDITNFVMVAMGQPLHAFDYTKIKDGEINICLSLVGDELITLDGKNHQLPKDTIIIKDKEKIYDLAGIMGGLNSEVDDNSKTIVLQGAIFDPILIRRASKKLAQTTDASYRYERGVDYEATAVGVDMAASLIKESCPEARIGKLFDIQFQKKEEVKITFALDKVNVLLGLDISKENAKKYLLRLNFQIENEQVIVPSFRKSDVKIWQDLAEEIARVFGYEKITEEKSEEKNVSTPNKDWQKREIIKDKIRRIGFTEILSNSFIALRQIKFLDLNVEDCQEIANPLSPETQYLRPSLLSSLLTQVAKNPWAPEIAVFVLGKVFTSKKEKNFTSNEERWQLGLATIGKKDDLLKKAREVLSLNFEIIDINQKILSLYKIRRPLKVVIFEEDKINVEIGEIGNEISEIQYREISKFPPTIYDLAFLVDADISSEEIKKSILEASSAIFLTEKFDEFTSDKFGKNKKNVAFHIWFQDIKKPMTDEEVDSIIKNIIQNIENKFQAKLRS